MPDWMIYGATGYTGQMVAEEAVRQGHRPLLVGRSASKLKPLAERLNLEYAIAPIEDAAALESAVRRVKLVYHAAGPFISTSRPMLRACLTVGAHYLDITGETSVYQNIYAYDSAAKEKGIALLPGIGFDFLPADSLARYVTDQLPDATHIVLAASTEGPSSVAGGISPGTAKSLLEILHSVGSVARRSGRLVRIPPGSEARPFRFPSGERWAMPVPWGDLEVVYRSTGIPNMTSYLTLPLPMIRLTRITGGLMIGLLHSSAIRNAMGKLIDRTITGPDEATRAASSAYVYAQVRNLEGKTSEAWLEIIESYQFTAAVGISVVENVLNGTKRGALTPSQAFGPDFVLTIAGTKRYDALA